MARKNSPYFTDFIAMAEFSCQAADYLMDSLKNFDPESLPKRLDALHDLEHKEDQIKHGLMKRLIKEFVSPIDREDIIQLADELDNVTDKIEDILIHMYMYNIKRVPKEAIDIASVIIKCCKMLKQIMVEFPSLQKSATLKQAIIDVNTMEEQGDVIYIDAVRALHMQGGNSLEIYSWSKVFALFEDCCDACESVADTVELIIMKNS